MSAFDIALAVMLVITFIRISLVRQHLGMIDVVLTHYIMSAPAEREEMVRKLKAMNQ